MFPSQSDACSFPHRIARAGQGRAALLVPDPGDEAFSGAGLQLQDSVAALCHEKLVPLYSSVSERLSF